MRAQAAADAKPRLSLGAGKLEGIQQAARKDRAKLERRLTPVPCHKLQTWQEQADARREERAAFLAKQRVKLSTVNEA